MAYRATALTGNWLETRGWGDDGGESASARAKGHTNLLGLSGANVPAADHYASVAQQSYGSGGPSQHFGSSARGRAKAKGPRAQLQKKALWQQALDIAQQKVAAGEVTHEPEYPVREEPPSAPAPSGPYYVLDQPITVYTQGGKRFDGVTPGATFHKNTKFTEVGFPTH
eukprot:TRINITY_DN4280_c0_g1_i1.p1 TRINITY_DN4280_c0_g1~~TRINITY_DN4280_c0_g1_i1.p1  ORF type:complete len:186 (+),score=40.27 TRINITY_DN4280_c0_g1_i1:52-558(+)